jgi:hypothetical protein
MQIRDCFVKLVIVYVVWVDVEACASFEKVFYCVMIGNSNDRCMLAWWQIVALPLAPTNATQRNAVYDLSFDIMP